MASSNILLFDANKANMMSDEQYNTNTQRLNGVQSGIASSQLQNKTLYQCSLVAYAIAQVMNQNGLDANDTAAVSAFVANLSGTMLQKVADLATTEEAKAGVSTGKWMSPALVKAAMDTFTANKWLHLAGGTMTGNLILNTSSPINALQAASKGYVDGKVSTSDTNNLNIFLKNDISSTINQEASTVTATTNFETVHTTESNSEWTPAVGSYFEYAFTAGNYYIKKSVNYSFGGLSMSSSSRGGIHAVQAYRIQVWENEIEILNQIVDLGTSYFETDFSCPAVDFFGTYGKYFGNNRQIKIRFTVTTINIQSRSNSYYGNVDMNNKFERVTGLLI